MTGVIGDYVRDNPYCEACARTEKSWPVDTVEVHHILGGPDRKDRVENIITLCREHHRRCTYHDPAYGREARGWNHRMLAIKLVKGDLDGKYLESLGEEWALWTYREAAALVESDAYLHGLRAGWYER